MAWGKEKIMVVPAPKPNKASQAELVKLRSQVAKEKEELVKIEQRKKDIRTELEAQFVGYRKSLDKQRIDVEAYRKKLHDQDVVQVAKEKELQSLGEQLCAQSDYEDKRLNKREDDLDSYSRDINRRAIKATEKEYKNKENAKAIVIERSEVNALLGETNKLRSEAEKEREEAAGMMAKALNQQRVTGNAKANLVKYRQESEKIILKAKKDKLDIDKSLDVLNSKNSEYLVNLEEFNKIQSAQQVEKKKLADLSIKLAEDEVALGERARSQTLERRELDGKINIIKKLRKEKDNG